MYFLVMNPLFFCCWQQFAIGLLAANASRHGGTGSGEWWRSICFSCFKKKYFIRKYLGVWLIWFGWFFFGAGESLILSVHSRAGVWIFLSR